MIDADKPWPRWLRVAFRFVAAFFVITTLYLAIAHLGNLIPYAEPLANAIAYGGLFAAYRWGVDRLFGSDVVYATNQGFIAYLSTALLGAALAAAVWSATDRHRLSYRRTHEVMRIYLRYLLAAAALSYGAMKVIPAQFAPPSLVALVTPLGEFTPMRLLWHFMGTSTAYIIFTGLLEVVGGLLLFSRRTTTLGALLLAAAFAHVTVLNFGYAVGVQLNSTIYALMAATLLAPDARRLTMFFLREQPVAGDARRLAPWIGRSVQAVVIVMLITVNFRAAYLGRRAATARPAAYGIYDVDDFALDGVTVQPTDGARWQRLVIAERGAAAIQRTGSGQLDHYVIAADPSSKALTFTKTGTTTPALTLQFRRDADGVVEVAGRFENHAVRARLRAIDHTRLPLRRPRQ